VTTRSGVTPVSAIERKGAGGSAGQGPTSIDVPRPVVGVVGGVQPDLLPKLADEAARHDGFLDRILWARPRVRPSRWTDEVSDATKAAAVEQFRRLRLRDVDAKGKPVRLSPEARDRWVHWHDGNVDEIAAATGLIRGMYAKLPNQLARITLILHALRSPNADLVTPETMDDAIRLVEYFRAHGRSVLGRLSDARPGPTNSLATRVTEVLRRRADWTDLTTIHRLLDGRTRADLLRDALNVLRVAGVVESRKVPTPGRPREEWRLVPSKK
jgi:hypothetical protein